MSDMEEHRRRFGHMSTSTDRPNSNNQYPRAPADTYTVQESTSRGPQPSPDETMYLYLPYPSSSFPGLDTDRETRPWQRATTEGVDDILYPHQTHASSDSGPMSTAPISRNEVSSVRLPDHINPTNTTPTAHGGSKSGWPIIAETLTYSPGNWQSQLDELGQEQDPSWAANDGQRTRSIDSNNSLYSRGWSTVSNVGSAVDPVGNATQYDKTSRFQQERVNDGENGWANNGTNDAINDYLQDHHGPWTAGWLDERHRWVSNALFGNGAWSINNEEEKEYPILPSRE
ncbi:hypothetical protein GGS23DRAFT_599207 [Durotheca rogersii]|uniref:uncharacterized protein n=1 Tax=Durotheca rogersii TaxID=419775 RepID=UPI0022211D43|nr:uncharacterized protein GGS23DRAFT_599207 [Durotheca rogersii]KAI5860688.1 hypothetical protein GGS23DRAFT_599207 [Durotheca rogersii]